jgi:1-acyl-sn-glycerol-3-phosphate acyltransferase
VARSIRSDVDERLSRLEIPWNRYGTDPYGVSRRHLAFAMKGLGFFYRYYFGVRAFGLHHVPPHGRGMLIGNHSGGIAVDGAMVIASCFFDLEPPRLAQGMVEKFMSQVPFASLWTSRTGQFTGLPEHAIRLLEEDRLLLVFPEGARGTAKLFRDRHSLVNFGTGFMRLALRTKTPIIPFGFLGGGEAIPTVTNLYSIGKAFGVPYIPVTPYGAAIPLPVRLQIHYGPPMIFSGNGTEDDEVIEGYVAEVKRTIQALIEQGRQKRKGLLGRVSESSKSIGGEAGQA